MTLVIGASFGSYQILAPLGAGGMGEVYRARDTKLNRDVALKILPDAFANDSDRLARFTREAQTLAALNHTNIAHIHGLEEAGGVRALVMELVEGEDLAQRIARGPIAIDEAVPIAIQIAEALEAAHEQGVVHRDLKPANIKIRADGTVKVLDFGLAKAIEGAGGARRAVGAGGAGTADGAVTVADVTRLRQGYGVAGETEAGLILGTAAYMSPEQARGKALDKRGDIWAFGCVLFEMLSGRRAFEGETLSDTIAAVLTRDPDWRALPAQIPSKIRTLLERCLARDSRQRVHDIADVRIELQDRAPAHVEPVISPPRRSSLRLAAAFAAGALIAAMGTWRAVRAPAPSPQPVRRFNVSGLTPLVIDAYQTLTLSPDGKALAFRGRGADGVERIFLRALDSLQLKALADTDGAKGPFFSPDGRWVGFFAGGALKKIALAGGSALTIAPAGVGATGGTWMDDGSIVFVGDADIGVQRIPASGGTPERLFSLDRVRGDRTVAAPAALPSSRGVLLSLWRGDSFAVAVLSLRDRRMHTLVENNAYSPLWLSTGHVLFHQGDALLALPFDAERLVATGAPFPVFSDMPPRISYQTRLFAVADDGTLAYVPPVPAGAAEWGAVWVDRNGRESPVTTFDRPADTPRFSPDDRRIAFRTPAPLCDVWVRDLARGTTTRVTHQGDNHGVVWTPDGLRITVARPHGDATDIVALPADGSGPEEKIASFPGESLAAPTSWRARDDVVLVDHSGRQTGKDISVVGRGGQPKPVVDSAYDDGAAVFSPDGHDLAYVSNESGRAEVYGRPYPEAGLRTQVSADGGVEPVWARSGRELFFRRGRDMLAAKVNTTPTFSAERPVVLFSGDYPFGPIAANYDVSADGTRFLMMKGRQWVEGQLVVVLNWFSEWKSSGAPR